MKIITEDKIKNLRKNRKVTGKDNSRLKPVVVSKKSKPKALAEERQIAAIESVVSEITKLVRANNKNAVIILEIIRKIKGFENIKFPEIPKMPETPKPIKRWRFNVERNADGFIDEITAEGE